MKFYIYIAIASIILIPLYFIFLKKGKDQGKVLKVYSVVLFIAHCMTLFYQYAIDSATIQNELLFPKNKLIFILLLRTLTPAAMACAVVSPFYENKSIKRICK